MSRRAINHLQSVLKIEMENLKPACVFSYKGPLSHNKFVDLEYSDFFIDNDKIRITNSSHVRKMGGIRNDYWLDSFYYKDAKQNYNLFYKHLANKYNINIETDIESDSKKSKDKNDAHHFDELDEDLKYWM
jgi:hypothetical protein